MKALYVIFGVGVIILGAYLIMVATGIVALPFKTVTEQIKSGSEIIEKTYDPDKAIADYEWFKQTYEDINACKQNAEVTKLQIQDFKETYGNSSDWDMFVNQQYSRLQTTYTGEVQYCNDLIADYNARIKMATRNIFSDKLPMYVDKILW